MMKLITKDTDYAVKALMYIASFPGRLTSVSNLSEELNIPKPFLRKILQVLHKERILKGSKGYGGGFRLARSADKIYLTDLIEIFQGPLKLNECIFKKKLCPDRKFCFLKKKIDDIEKYVVLKLESITIASLIKRGG